MHQVLSCLPACVPGTLCSAAKAVRACRPGVPVGAGGWLAERQGAAILVFAEAW